MTAVDGRRGLEDDGETAELQRWIGRRETANDIAGRVPAMSLAATLDCSGKDLELGEELPPLWHWLYFSSPVATRDLGIDGHPKRGGFLPPVRLPRRLWAGGRLQFHGPLRIGDALVRESTIADVRQRAGRSGALVLVTVRHRIGSPGEFAITEEHDIVYREAVAGTVAPTPAPTDATFSRRIVPHPVLLFRYSALTNNSHRIHYDRPYATEVEGYPGLVVHGPLIATLLMQDALTQCPDARPVRFEFKAVSPLFDTAPFEICGKHAEPGAMDLWARGPDGALAMRARLEFTE